MSESEMPQPGRHTEVPATGSNGLAIAGFVLSLLGVLGSWIPVLNVLCILLAVVGVVLASIGLAKSKKVGAGKGLAVTGIVLGVVAVMIAIAVNVVFVDAVDDALNETLGGSPRNTTGENKDAQEEALANAKCAYAGTGGLRDDMQVDLTFTNQLGEVDDVEVTYALLEGKGGTRFHTASTSPGTWIKFLTAQEKFRLRVDTHKELPADIDEETIDCTVLAIEEDSNLLGDYKRASDKNTCEVTGTDPSGGIKIRAEVTNPYNETAKVQTWWALRAGSVTFETDTEVVDLVKAGEPFTITPEFGPDKPDWVAENEVTCDVLGFWNQKL